MAEQTKDKKEDKESGFRLEQLFGSKTRARLLGVFLGSPEEAFFVRELTRKIDAQLNSVRREIQNLLDLGLVREKPSGKDGKGADNKKYFQANRSSVLFSDLRSLIQKSQILMNQNLVQEIDEIGTIEYLALTGKFMRNHDMDVDLLIVGEMPQKTLRMVVSRFEQELGDEVNYTMMPREEFLYRKQITDRFLFSILDSDNIVMIDRVPVPEE